jgi:hypothetical protein
MISSLIVVSLVTSAAGGTAQQSAAASAEAKPVKEKKICRIVEGEATSRMRRRVCRTAKEMESEREQDSGAELKRISGN